MIGVLEGDEGCQDFVTHKPHHPENPQILKILIIMVGYGGTLRIHAWRISYI
jgi:hypothetical protein